MTWLASDGQQAVSRGINFVAARVIVVAVCIVTTHRIPPRCISDTQTDSRVTSTKSKVHDDVYMQLTCTRVPVHV
jgi:hypothetical protein